MEGVVLVSVLGLYLFLCSLAARFLLRLNQVTPPPLLLLLLLLRRQRRLLLLLLLLLRGLLLLLLLLPRLRLLLLLYSFLPTSPSTKTGSAGGN